LEGPPCSKTSEHGRREETSGGDPGSGGDPEGASGGVRALLGHGVLSLEGEHGHSVPLLSSIVLEWRKSKVNPKREREGM
jgi:hypothetical protein